MTCHCSSAEEHNRRAEQQMADDYRWAQESKDKQIALLKQDLATMKATLNNKEFEILDVEEKSPYIIVKVQYPSCKACNYEGKKILVYKNVTLLNIIKWKEIDPHFSETKREANQAPSPIARFPFTDEGLHMARLLVSALKPSPNYRG